MMTKTTMTQETLPKISGLDLRLSQDKGFWIPRQPMTSDFWILTMAGARNSKEANNGIRKTKDQ
jgi:hypothetical protein